MDFKTIIINTLLIPFFFAFSFLVPKKKGLLLLGSGLGVKFMGNPKYFFLWLNKNNQTFNYFWITEDDLIFSKLNDEKLPVLSSKSLKGFIKILRAEWLIVEQSTQDITGKNLLFGNFNIINTWHGIPIKNISVDLMHFPNSVLNPLKRFLFKKEQENYNFFLACSKESARTMKLGLGNKNVKVFGYPRDDIFFDRNLLLEKDVVKKSYKKFKKIFLYAPTFRDNSIELKPFTKKFLNELNSYLSQKKYLLIYRAHPLTEERMEMFEKSNIKNASRFDDIQELLLETDYLIADYSSLIFDFCLTDRPIIFYSFDYNEYLKTSRNMFYDYYKEMPGPFAKDQDQLLELIKEINIWSKNKKYQKKYHNFKNKFHRFQNGKSSERLFNFLKKELA